MFAHIGTNPANTPSQIWPAWGRNRPKFVEVAPNELDPNRRVWPGIEPTLTDLDPCRAEFDQCRARNPGIVQNWSAIEQTWTRINQNVARVGQIWPEIVQKSFVIGQTRTISTNVGPSSANFGQVWPGIDQIWPALDQLWPMVKRVLFAHAQGTCATRASLENEAGRARRGRSRGTRAATSRTMRPWHYGRPHAKEVFGLEHGRRKNNCSDM